jgi:hypothetical protein
MPSPDDIADQLEILVAHRATLAEYLKQQALLGVAYAPPGVANGIRLTRDAIKQSKATLRDWGAEVEDHPDDDAVLPITSASASEQASLGLTAMADLIRAPDVRAILEGFKDSFRIICQQIDRLSNYKDLHDLLHDLQFNCYNPIIRGARDFPNNPLFVESLEDYTAELQKIVNSLWEVTERSVFSSNEQTWIQQFSPTVELLRGAIEHTNRELLDRATFQIGRVLYVHPTRINMLLKGTARDLPLPSLINAMASIHQYSARSDFDAEKLRQVSQGVTALEQLSQNLTQMIDEHDTWQEIELELHRIEEDFEQHVKELEWLWPDMKAQLIPLYDGRDDRWNQELRQAVDRLERALATQTPATTAAAFRPFRRQAGLCFFQADKKLKELCRSLRRIDGPLSSVLRVIA